MIITMESCRCRRRSNNITKTSVIQQQQQQQQQQQIIDNNYCVRGTIAVIIIASLFVSILLFRINLSFPNNNTNNGNIFITSNRKILRTPFSIFDHYNNDNLYYNQETIQTIMMTSMKLMMMIPTKNRGQHFSFKLFFPKFPVVQANIETKTTTAFKSSSVTNNKFHSSFSSSFRSSIFTSVPHNNCHHQKQQRNHNKRYTDSYSFIPHKQQKQQQSTFHCSPLIKTSLCAFTTYPHVQHSYSYQQLQYQQRAFFNTCSIRHAAATDDGMILSRKKRRLRMEQVRKKELTIRYQTTQSKNEKEMEEMNDVTTPNSSDTAAVTDTTSRGDDNPLQETVHEKTTTENIDSATTTSSEEEEEDLVKTQHIKDVTMKWLERIVMGLNLCPFAERSHRLDQIHYEVIYGTDESIILLGVFVAMCKLETEPGTTLIICPDLYPTNFDAYWDISQMIEYGLLEQHDELRSIVQVAPFHPLFVFDTNNNQDEENDEDTTNEESFDNSPVPLSLSQHTYDPGDWTNRSPYPMFHILREVEVTKAVELIDGDASRVYQRNVHLLTTLYEKLGRTKFEKYLQNNNNKSNNKSNPVNDDTITSLSGTSSKSSTDQGELNNKKIDVDLTEEDERFIRDALEKFKIKFSPRISKNNNKKKKGSKK